MLNHSLLVFRVIVPFLLYVCHLVFLSGAHLTATKRRDMPGTTNFDVIQAVPRVATLIYQTHQLWQEIKEVPEGIQSLVDHLKALEPIFADIEDQFSHDEASAPFKNCLDLSRKAHDSLGALVADMRTQLQANKRLRRKYAAVKVVLNKTVLTRLEQSLSRCMNFLQLAIQAYQM